MTPQPTLTSPQPTSPYETADQIIRAVEAEARAEADHDFADRSEYERFCLARAMTCGYLKAMFAEAFYCLSPDEQQAFLRKFPVLAREEKAA